MADIPVIVVQLIHIGGPLKGEIQEFSDPEISIGRHPSCHVQFPKDLRIVSREHARIIREGNRFKLTNLSMNGTYLNGERKDEAYLKDGDVLIFAEGGPKVSFLTRIEAGRPYVDIAPLAKLKPSQAPPEIFPAEPSPVSPIQPKPRPSPKLSVEKVKIPLIIQYGPTLRSFNKLPITIGKSPSCDFVLDHPSVLDQHIKIFFSQNQYWVEDLTGRQSVCINGQPIQIKAPLNPDDQLELTAQGPKFRFLAGGRLAEIEDTKFESPVNEQPEKEALVKKTDPSKRRPKMPGSIFKKFFSE